MNGMERRFHQIIVCVKRYYRILIYFITVKKIWEKPRQRKILLYDAAHYNLLRNYLKEEDIETLHLCGEQINMHVLFACFFSTGNVFKRYIDCFIRYVQPNLIITMIDNRVDFYSVSKRHPHIKTVFIQNGVRCYAGSVFEFFEQAKTSSCLFDVTHMLVFGHHVGSKYLEYVKGNVLAMGSLKNNMVPICQEKKQANTIGFISQYRTNNTIKLGEKVFRGEEFFEKPINLVLEFLGNYAQKFNKKILIILCSGYFQDDTLEKEKAYYTKLLDGICDFEFANYQYYGSSYEAIDSAEVIVTIDSTLGYESASRGNKTAFFSIRGFLLGLVGLGFGWPGDIPDHGSFWTNVPTEAFFEKILHYLFELDDKQWKSDLDAVDFSSIMSYDLNNNKLQTLLATELGLKPSEMNE